jgi:hypothetical protein
MAAKPGQQRWLDRLEGTALARAIDDNPASDVPVLLDHDPGAVVEVEILHEVIIFGTFA